MTSNSTNRKFKTNTERLDLKSKFSIYTRQWKWFALSCITFLVIGFFYLRYATPKYNAYGKIMLMDDKNVSSPADAILQDLSKISSVEKELIDDEIEVIKSRKLMKEVVKNLDLNVQIFSKGRLHDSEFFPHSEAPIRINFIASDSLIYESDFEFSLLFTSENTFDFKYFPDPGAEEITKKAVFGKNITTPVGDILITPNVEDISFLINEVIFVKISTLDKIAEYYKNTIRVSPAVEGSKVVNLSLDDYSWAKAIAIINTLVDEYNRTSIEEKNIRSNNTAEFINKRIDLIATDLSNVDNEIERFKTGNKLTNITSEADLYLKNNAQTEQQLAASRTEYSKINYMKSQIMDDSFNPIPANVGLSDAGINATASKYNDLLNERNRLLKSSSEKNPLIINLDEQLNSLKSGLSQSLDNAAQTVGLQIRSLENQSAKISSKIYAVPGQVRKSRDIQREQGIKESLYLYLLQKREEATISLISTSPNARTIDEAHSEKIPVYPKNIMVYLICFIIGLGIPYAVLYIKQLLDTKIHNKEDLQKIIGIMPVLGEIPRISTSGSRLIERNDRSILSESFRIIRTNFDYINRNRKTEKYHNVVFVTSTINGEGKSFVSLNMALTKANTGKKVLLLGSDIRNPQIYSAIKTEKNKDRSDIVGLTEYLANESVSISDTINRYSINDINIDIILSGKVPPNPAELLMNERIKPLFDKVSSEYDYVVVDTAPAMLVTDTLLISEYSGNTIYITRADHTEKKILNFAKELQAENKLNNMMLVVNDVKQSNFGYGAKYGYYGAPKKQRWFSFGKA
ncbi:capsular exopolysaccharide family [Hyunsoonleella jejuensis]|uniref:non-specific protein-tyrosine kinase n=1 Tax=Hyunsoonleella jejuensis TaxID=419940 RepID=A0A1H9G667_9FLAO|nr:polysaccharide biosynthesis tyrosine autokinase [Hyunsoonleella jejuensis]SEQ45533.1 capsular exopolysaccharide family [Hyunsoonleella jejuensis]